MSTCLRGGVGVWIVAGRLGSSCGCTWAVDDDVTQVTTTIWAYTLDYDFGCTYGKWAATGQICSPLDHARPMHMPPRCSFKGHRQGTTCRHHAAHRAAVASAVGLYLVPFTFWRIRGALRNATMINATTAPVLLRPVFSVQRIAPSD